MSVRDVPTSNRTAASPSVFTRAVKTYFVLGRSATRWDGVTASVAPALPASFTHFRSLPAGASGSGTSVAFWPHERLNALLRASMAIAQSSQHVQMRR